MDMPTLLLAFATYNFTPKSSSSRLFHVSCRRRRIWQSPLAVLLLCRREGLMSVSFFSFRILLTSELLISTTAELSSRLRFSVVEHTPLHRRFPSGD